MMNTSTFKRFVSLAAFAAALVVVSGNFSEVSAQRDPFQKPGFMKPKPAVQPAKPKPVKVEKPIFTYTPPTAEARVEYYKRLRAEAVANGQPIPKPTSVMTLNELAVSGIFKTPRGYAAIVEAMPIKLSYTIYPGEKFFDGQLVAVDENRLVFRKVTKVGEGKFISSVENKPIKTFNAKNEATTAAAPPPPVDKPVETAAAGKPVKPAPNPFLSPVDEMNSQPAEQPKEPAKSAKKPAKVAKNKK